MKKYILFKTVLGLVSLLSISCEKDAITPDINFTATPTTVEVDETVNFTIAGSAETFVIFNGDTGHEFINSHIAINEGQELNLAKIVLTAEVFSTMTAWIQTQIESYNQDAKTPVDEATVFSQLAQMVGVNYVNKEVPKYQISTTIFPEKPNIGTNIVDTYFEDQGTLLAPTGGYSTGTALNRYSPSFTYAYSQAGVYTATLVATNVSDKNYSGSGSINDRTSSASEYDYFREIKHVIITVQ